LRTIGDLTNKEENVQFDGLDVIRDIEKADKLASEGLLEWDPGKLIEAETLRPNDWRIQEQNAIVKFDSGMPQVSFDSSDFLLIEQIKRSGNCVYLRRQQMEYRESLLANNIENCAKQHFCNKSMMIQEQEKTLNELVYIRDKGNSIFCDQLK